jgi:tetratricopeptide (TPR) repeat protein
MDGDVKNHFRFKLHSPIQEYIDSAERRNRIEEEFASAALSSTSAVQLWDEIERIAFDWTTSHDSEAEAWFALGYAREKKGYLSRAVSDYRKALQMDPTLSDARLRLDNLEQVLAGGEVPKTGLPESSPVAVGVPRALLPFVLSREVAAWLPVLSALAIAVVVLGLIAWGVWWALIAPRSVEYYLTNVQARIERIQQCQRDNSFESADCKNAVLAVRLLRGR